MSGTVINYIDIYQKMFVQAYMNHVCGRGTIPEGNS